MNIELSDAYRRCAATTRREARNFYYGLKLLPEPKRSALYGIYAWMRLVDDIADDDSLPPDEARRQLEFVRTMTRSLFRGGAENRSVPEEPIWIALRDIVARYPLRVEPFDMMIDGQLADLKHAGYATFDELRAYCHNVASTVGLICIDIWGYDDPAARTLAVDQGVAFQLTNILRDFREDLARDRVYLPHEDFEAAGLTPEALAAWSDADACTQFVHAQVDRAHALYERSEALTDCISPECRPTQRAMRGIYRGLLDRIRAQPALVASTRRARLSTLAKLHIALAARLKGHR